MKQGGNKCIFLDRDGVLNTETGDYITSVKDFIIKPRVGEALNQLKKAGFLLIVITNQGGLCDGLYSRADMNKIHKYLQQETGNFIDAFYYSPYRGKHTASLVHKPGTLMIEKAVSKYNIDLSSSWMVGDMERDIQAGIRMGLRTILISEDSGGFGENYVVGSLYDSLGFILGER